MNQNWHWHTEQNGSYLTCDLLSNWQHGFFTKNFYPQTPEKLVSVWQAEISAYRVQQVHDNLVLSPQEITEIISHQDHCQTLAKADAVISDRPKQSVWVASADCTPVLIGDLATGQVCAIHAGWRGAAEKIVFQAVSRFLNFGSTVENLRIAIGPAISGAQYQVDSSVAAQVGQSITSEELLSETDVISRLKQLDQSPILDDEQPGKVRLDVPLVNQIQLEQLGISKEQIAIAPYCTFQASEQFFSYRRTGDKKVQWSGIVSG